MKMRDNFSEVKGIRDGYGQGLVEAGEANPNVVAIDADLAKSTKSIMLQKVHPNQFHYAGISEQNMIGTAVGLALEGKRVFASSFSIFLLRAFEIIRHAVCYTNVPVKIVGSHSGLHTGEDGGSAQSLSDISVFRTLANMNVIVPADYEEARKATLFLASFDEPAYLRTCRNKSPCLYDDYKFELGKAVELKKGKDGTIIATGMPASNALMAGFELEKEGIDVSVLNMHTIKPIDRNAILNSAKKGPILTVEDHFITGGLGSAVSEVLAENGAQSKMLRLGMRRFGESGKPDELYEKYKLDIAGIKETYVNFYRD